MLFLNIWRKFLSFFLKLLLKWYFKRTLWKKLKVYVLLFIYLCICKIQTCFQGMYREKAESWYCPTKINQAMMLLCRWLYHKFIMSVTKFNYHCPFWWTAAIRKKKCTTAPSTDSENVFSLFWPILFADQIHLNIYKLQIILTAVYHQYRSLQNHCKAMWVLPLCF